MEKNNDCIFCNSTETILHSIYDESVVVVYDTYPVVPGHMLVYPKEHIESFVDVLSTLPCNQTIHENMCGSLWEDISECIEWATDKALENADGVNIGVNVGKAAGQVVMHCHFHIIPRHLDGPKLSNGSYGGVRLAVPDSSDRQPDHIGEK